MNLPTILLLTDFGDKDGFVGVMKSVICSKLTRPVAIVDLCHHIAPQDLRHGAWVLQSALPYLPQPAVLVAVVDPAVGAQEQASLLAYWPERRQIFLAPDSGLLTPVLEAAQNALQVYHIQNSAFYQETTARRSRTFHGRDVYAPIAAMVANALMSETLSDFLAGFGAPVSSTHRLKSVLPERSREAGRTTLKGAVVHIDHFGNVITNIPGHWLPKGVSASLTLGHRTFGAICLVEAYQYAPNGEVAMIISSGGTVELAIRQGSAAEHLEATAGQEVSLGFQA
jgi:S-adenosylmethionine hydrolase